MAAIAEALAGGRVILGGELEALLTRHRTTRPLDQAGIAWLRFEGYDPATVVAEQTEFGLRELDPTDMHLVGLEYWHASQALPADFLRMLPSPPVSVSR